MQKNILKKLQTVCQVDGDLELAERVESLSDTHQTLAHTCSNGRPILLALLVDYLSVGEHPEVLETISGQRELEKFVNQPLH